jgi:hypothetical protein
VATQTICQVCLAIYKEAQKQESAYKKYIAKTNLESATFITNYVQNFDVSFVSEYYIAFVFNQHTNTGGIVEGFH